MVNQNVFTNKTITVGNYGHVVKVYKKCPYCDCFVTPQYKNSVNLTFETNIAAVLSLFHLECCNKNVITVHIRNKETNAFDFLYSYPNLKPEVLPDSIPKISERATKIYNQAQRAYMNNDFELATIGYRSFVEILSKDFLIKEQNKDENKIKSLKLNNVLKELSDDYLLIAGDVIRYLGNDKTHYEEKHSDISIETLKFYLDIFIDSIHVKYSINHPPDNLSRQK